MIRSLPRRSVAAFLLFSIAGSLILASTVRAQDATPNACAVPPAQTPMTRMGSPMTEMHMNQEFDLLFIDMMIPHHQSAIAMAKVALERASHQEVRDLAQAIVTTQQSEIDQMTAWRETWYPGAPKMPMEQMGQMMASMMQGMPGMMGTPGAGMTGMSGMMETMDPHAMVEGLCTAGGDFDAVFLRMMIPHHESAVAMAQVAVQRATHPEIKQLARAIIDAQQREIAQMQGWLAAWPGAEPGATPTGSA